MQSIDKGSLLSSFSTAPGPRVGSAQPPPEPADVVQLLLQLPPHERHRVQEMHARVLEDMDHIRDLSFPRDATRVQPGGGRPAVSPTSLREAFRSTIERCAEKILKAGREIAKLLTAVEARPELAAKLRPLGPVGAMLSGVANAVRAASDGDLSSMLVDVGKALEGLRKGVGALLKDRGPKLLGKEIPLVSEGFSLWDARQASGKSTQAAQRGDALGAQMWDFVAYANMVSAELSGLRDLAGGATILTAGFDLPVTAPFLGACASGAMVFACIGDMVASALG